jgi:type VI secretion system secreted protein VgrG
MASFDNAVAILLKNEGGFSDNPHDNGHATNFGITFQFYKSIHPEAVEDDIRNLTKEQAIEIYKTEFWNNSNIELITSQVMANSIFDAVVNMGKNPAIKILQRAVNSVKASHSFLTDDGILGEETLNAVNSISSIPLRTAFRSERAAYYREIVARNPAQVAFLEGWLSRAYST